MAPDSERFWALVDKRGPDDCWLWQGRRDKDGYGRFSAGQKRFYAHRFAKGCLEAAVDSFVLHRCNNPSCCNPSHLYIGSKADNMRDCLAAGNHRCARLKGERHGRARLTTADVVAIRASTKSQRATAREFGVSPTCVSAIRLGINWRHI